MSTLEDIEATKLAEWLDDPTDSGVPLSDDIAPAIYAIRPDLAPESRLSLDDILERVQTGPFSTQSSEDLEDVSRDEEEFVRNLFAISKSSESPKTTLDDVLTRVQTGPFVDDTPTDGDGRTIQSLTTPVANNNRWWTSPWFGMGVAAALVLVILLPSNFEAPQQEESIFTIFEAEEPPLEDVDAGEYLERTMPKTAPKKASSSKTVLKERGDDVDSNEATIPVELSESKPTRTLEATSTSKGLNAQSEAVPEMKKEAEFSSSTIVSSNDYVSETDVLVSEGLDAPVDVDEEPHFDDATPKEYVEEVSVADMEPTIEFEGFAMDASELSRMQAPSARTQSVEEVVQSREGVVDGILSSRRLRGSKKSKAKAPVEEAIPVMAEEEDQVSAIQSLPDTLSELEKSTLNTADTESIIGMCDPQNPTKSLDILWFASLPRESSDAIALLLRSSQYDYGDTRYLKRNWMRLSQIYATQGNVQRAQYYQQMADALP